MAARIFLTLLGAAGMVVGAFLVWLNDTLGTNLSFHAFYQTTFDTTNDFVKSVGFVSIVLGLLAVVGLANRAGSLTRLAGALGIVALVLFGIEVFRSSATVYDIGVGAWVALAGSLVALIGGFVGRMVTVVGAAPVAPVDEEL